MKLAIVCALALLAAPAMAGVCPDNEVFTGGSFDAVGFSSNAPTGTFGPTGVVPWDGSPCQNGCYDLVAGKLVAVGWTNTVGGGLSGVKTRDIYQVVGPGGPPLAFEAVLIVQAVLAPHISFTASLDGPGPPATCAGGPDCEAAIPLSFAPGTPFTLEADLVTAGENGVFPEAAGVATGTIRFRGLPAGYSIVSCQNYDLPTPALPATWGGVKALYR
jgi:hypothetical protein